MCWPWCAAPTQPPTDCFSNHSCPFTWRPGPTATRLLVLPRRTSVQDAKQGCASPVPSTACTWVVAEPKIRTAFSRSNQQHNVRAADTPMYLLSHPEG